jgi:hypothetical protein
MIIYSWSFCPQMDGKCCTLPPAEWIWVKYYHQQKGTIYRKLGGFLKKILFNSLRLAKTRPWEKKIFLFHPKYFVQKIRAPTHKTSHLKATLYSMLSFQCWRRQYTRIYHEAASTHCWRQLHSVTALAMYAMTLVTAWMPWRRNMDLLVPAGRPLWLQSGFLI